MIQKKMSPKAQCMIAIVLFLSLISAPVFAADDNGVASLRKTSQAFSSVAKKAIPAVVYVKVEKNIQVQRPQYNNPGLRGPFDQFFDDFFQQQPNTPQQYRQEGQGSGFIISKDGYILTNHHVVGDADKITVRLRDGREFKAKKVGTDEKTDIALIKIEGNDFPVINLGDSDKLEIGEWVMAIGNPFGLTETVTVGIVSAKGRSTVGITDYEDFIQTDAAINPGNSGGPLINLDGEVIGINSAIFSKSGGYMGIGFAIPVNMARNVKDQLLETGKVRRGQLGVIIQNINQELADSMELSSTKGVLVADVLEDSAAAKAGLKTGDIIVELNGKEVEGVGPLRNEIAMTTPGTQIDLKVNRNGKMMDIKVSIGELDENAVANAELTPSDFAAKLGLKVDNIDESYKDYFEGDMPESGVIVTRVNSGSEAERKGITPGTVIISVNRKKVSSVNEFNQAMAEAAKNNKVLLLVKEKQYTRFVPLTLE